ncbi:MAG TPA: ATP-dependent helicase, partial [Candidatus Ozemobacteraceae bacterium]|nr:ATP-dependent helicase [Candidatus Ozemobacteraceae bacterium]
IRLFPERFPDCRVIRLERNYRSTKPLLTSTNRLMEHAKEGFAKKLFTEREGGMQPVLAVCSDETEQSSFVAQRVLELREEGIALSRIAVLFRSSYHAFQLELELKRRHIPYVKWGGYKFLEAAHIKDLLSHVRVLLNPSDRVAWLRILLLIDGVGAKTAGALFERIHAASDPFDLESLAAPPRAREGLASAAAMLRRARGLVEGAPIPVVEAVADYYGPVLKRRYDDFPRRLRDLDQLTVLAGKYQTVPEMLSEMALEPPRDSIDDVIAADEDDEDRLILSTVHSAKGLEWHTVFIIWALEGRFPSFGALRNPADIEEERRLMYVGMTRAQEQLYITHPALAWDPASGATLSQPSRFLTEIGPELMERWELRTVP